MKPDLAVVAGGGLFTAAIGGALLDIAALDAAGPVRSVTWLVGVFAMVAGGLVLLGAMGASIARRIR